MASPAMLKSGLDYWLAVADYSIAPDGMLSVSEEIVGEIGKGNDLVSDRTEKKKDGGRYQHIRKRFFLSRDARNDAGILIVSTRLRYSDWGITDLGSEDAWSHIHKFHVKHLGTTVSMQASAGKR